MLDLAGKCRMSSNHVNGDISDARDRPTPMRILVYQLGRSIGSIRCRRLPHGNPETVCHEPLACLEAPPAQGRDATIDRVRAEHNCRYRELATGHDAMITAPCALTRLLLQIAQPAS